jgi:hypothetical protein
MEKQIKVTKKALIFDQNDQTIYQTIIKTIKTIKNDQK